MPVYPRNPNIFAQAATVMGERKFIKGDMFLFDDPTMVDMPFGELRKSRSKIKGMCIMGAIIYAGWRLRWPSQSITAAITWADKTFGRTESMPTWNDQDERTRQDVIIRLRMLASQAEREHPPFMHGGM